MVAKAANKRTGGASTSAQPHASNAQAASTSRPKRKPRKRRRRGIMSDSDDSSGSSSDEEDGDEVAKVVPVSEPMAVDSVPTAAAVAITPAASSSPSSASSSASSASSSSSESSSESSSSESDSSSDSSDEDEDDSPNGPPQPAAVHHRPYAMSPTPPPVSLPSFLPSKSAAADGASQNVEEERRAKFRKIWMGKVVEAFGPDLEQIRQNEPALTATRLSTLIDSLAAGIDIFNDHTQPSSRPDEVDEVAFIVETSTE